MSKVRNIVPHKRAHLIIFQPLSLLEIISYKILAVQKEDLALDHLMVGGTKTYRIEEIPGDEVNTTVDELLIPVAHFQKVGSCSHSASYRV